MTKFRPKGGRKRRRRTQREPESWELTHGVFTPMGTVEQLGKRLRAMRYSPIRKEAWLPMFVLIGVALGLMFLSLLIYVLVQALT